MGGLLVLAAETNASGLSDTLKTAMNTAFQNVTSDVMGLIETALPFAMGVIGATLAISIGIGVFKSLTAKA